VLLQHFWLGLSKESAIQLIGKDKLHSKWEGPFTVVNSSTHGAITIQDNDSNTFEVNGQ
jgi:hypothetical protein